jgi:transposase
MATSKASAAPRPRRRFSEEFRREAVRLVLERPPNVSFTQIARQLELTAPQLRVWVKAREAEGSGRSVGGTRSTESGRKETPAQELRRLRREVEELRQERDFAKKAAAYFARDAR